MSIDWSTAPEGATHWEPRGPDFSEGWMKKEGNEWFYWGEGTNKWFKGKLSCNVSAEREATFEARPQEAWDGQSLPPVGITCESWRSGVRRIVKILGHGDEYIFVREDDGREILLSIGDGREFRPIRTPEQIAAEERSKECDRIFFILSNVEREGNRSDMAEALYDAGLRLTNKK
ncbi:hypothetical protein [Pseudomonas aeruginosa]|uniref:hypothetical protein n=1 Tax=Pseudomonas aeruginosa TaxID=287 RepID=UPI000B9BF591|nr:hypothetical protein [Pseudomonas aeruginosa]OXT86554.1 hypothetical protein CF340_13460 [Pseudomonas aeruginosa]